MSIISISRGSLAGATSVAEKVAAGLNIPCVSREIIVEAAREGGISESALNEQIDHPPTSLFNNYSKERDVYIWYIRSALCQRACEGSFVYHGHGGHLLLADISSLLRISVVAPMAYRADAVMKERHLSRRAAEKYIKNIDKWRAKWCRLLYGVNWLDPAHHDLCINLEKIDEDSASRMVVETSSLAPFSQTEENQQEIANAALISRVSASLAKSGDLFTSQLTLTAKNNTLTIEGKARSKQICDGILRNVETSIGDAELHFEVVAAMDDVSWKH